MKRRLRHILSQYYLMKLWFKNKSQGSLIFIQWNGVLKLDYKDPCSIGSQVWIDIVSVKKVGSRWKKV